MKAFKFFKYFRKIKIVEVKILLDLKNHHRKQKTVLSGVPWLPQFSHLIMITTTYEVRGVFISSDEKTGAQRLQRQMSLPSAASKR